eukprot:CAMPEP_0178454332 /NCGR_PEP_ID=MMETSP0689_2-20121128/45303_1 /TAXON_ID=160604 /ORGANISM="Amphidinium massartii, Strain CS-259" /LENGTH=126 /DNA_ID=CAMNT_0020080261 /DNA_START=420 /DNA_END=798 /DNA_ORIENTATION=-
MLATYHLLPEVEKTSTTSPSCQAVRCCLPTLPPPMQLGALPAEDAKEGADLKGGGAPPALGSVAAHLAALLEVAVAVAEVEDLGIPAPLAPESHRLVRPAGEECCWLSTEKSGKGTGDERLSLEPP